MTPDVFRSRNGRRHRRQPSDSYDEHREAEEGGLRQKSNDDQINVGWNQVRRFLSVCLIICLSVWLSYFLIVSQLVYLVGLLKKVVILRQSNILKILP